MASADLVLIPIVGILAVAVLTLLLRRRNGHHPIPQIDTSEDLAAARQALSEMRQQTELELASARTLAEAELADARSKSADELADVRSRLEHEMLAQHERHEIELEQARHRVDAEATRLRTARAEADA